MHLSRTLRRLSPFVFAAALAAAPAKAEDLTLILDWFVNPDHVPIVIAKAGGYFEREGLNVEIVAPADPGAPPRLVAAGEADVAVTYQPDLMLYVSEGLPLVRFGTLIETPLNSLIVLEDGPIQSLEDLRGKTIGYSVATIQDAYIDAILGSVGLSSDDVTMVNVNFNLTTALMAGQVDAAIDGYRNVELIQLGLEGRPGRAFYPEEHGVPIYDELIFVANSADRDAPWLPRFVAAIEQASVWTTNHPEEALAMFLAEHPDLDDELNRLSFAATLPRFAKRPAALDAGRYERFATFLQENGVIGTVPALGDYAVEPR